MQILPVTTYLLGLGVLSILRNYLTKDKKAIICYKRIFLEVSAVARQDQIFIRVDHINKAMLSSLTRQCILDTKKRTTLYPDKYMYLLLYVAKLP